MKPEIASFLLSDSTASALLDLAKLDTSKPAQHLATLSRLRQIFNSEEAAALLELAIARQKAAQSGKFKRAERMFFTKTALEQASGEIIAEYRAGRFAKFLGQGSRVADLGCGIGGDSLALAREFQVTGVDLDEVRLAFAHANAKVYGLENRFQTCQADIADFDARDYDALFFDPARRTAEGRRLFSVEDYTPSLSIIKKWLPHVSNIAVKISPGVDYAELRDYDCEVEIISENGDVKEAVLWFGRLKTYGISRRATLLPSGDTLVEKANKPDITLSEPLKYLYEPDGAVIRAGLVEELALQISACKLDNSIAYLTTSELIKTPFAKSYTVIDSLGFSLKGLNRRLNELDIGKIVVKKRGSPIEPQELERMLKLKGSKSAFVVLTHVKNQHSAIICENPPL